MFYDLHQHILNLLRFWKLSPELWVNFLHGFKLNLTKLEEVDKFCLYNTDKMSRCWSIMVNSCSKLIQKLLYQNIQNSKSYITCKSGIANYQHWSLHCNGIDPKSLDFDDGVFTKWASDTWIFILFYVCNKMLIVSKQ